MLGEFISHFIIDIIFNFIGGTIRWLFCRVWNLVFNVETPNKYLDI